MKEVVFDYSPKLAPKEENVVDLHSIFNILNVLVCELSLVSMLLDEARAIKLTQLENEIAAIAQGLEGSDDLGEVLALIRKSETAVVSQMRELLNELKDEETLKELSRSLSNIESVYRIVNKRLDEFEARQENPDVWVSIRSQEFEEQFREVFYAIEKNAKGRYRIFFNLARKNTGDYYIDLKIESALHPELLWIPMRLIDVLRDLTANARKYTQPGGKVALAVYQSVNEILVFIEDSGCGIPADEIEQVVEFGYRATNVRERTTMGGGFGLTKAVWLVHKWGGQVAISSEIGVGTTVRLTVPNKLPAELGT